MQVMMVAPFALGPRGTMPRGALPLAKSSAACSHHVEVVLPLWSCPEDSGRDWYENGVDAYNIALPSPGSALRCLPIVCRQRASLPQGRRVAVPAGSAGQEARFGAVRLA